MFATYRPSGALRMSTVSLFLAAIVVGAIAAWPYQWLINTIASTKMGMVMAMLLGLGTGALGMLAVKRGHCRNAALALALALPLALVPVAASHYFNYQFAVQEIIEQHPGTPRQDIVKQLTLAGFLESRIADGWTVSSRSSRDAGTEYKGTIVWVMWLLEALVVLGITIGMVLSAVRRPYCESCGAWCADRVLMLHNASRALADPAIAAGDLDAVLALRAENAPPPPDPRKRFALSLKAAICDQCRQVGFLDVSEVSGPPNKANARTVRLVRQAVLQPAQVQTFLRRAQEAVQNRAA